MSTAWSETTRWVQFLVELKASAARVSCCQPPTALTSPSHPGYKKRGERIGSNVISMRLVILTGASGSGKTAIAEAIATELQSLVEVLHFDRIGVPPVEDMLAGWGAGEAWQRACIVEWLNRISAMRYLDRPVLFEGQMRLAFIEEGCSRQGSQVRRSFWWTATTPPASTGSQSIGVNPS